MSFAFAPHDVADLPAEQKVAIMETFVIAIVADQKVVKSETEQFDREVEAIDWGMEQAELIAQLKDVRARILALSSGKEAAELLQSVAARLTDPGLREKTFRAMAAIMCADRDMAPGETAVLGAYAKTFELPRDRYEAIKADVLGG